MRRNQDWRILRRAIAGTVAVLVLGTGGQSLAADKTWTGGSGSWSDGSKWAPTGAPSNGDNTHITGNDAAAWSIGYDDLTNTLLTMPSAQLSETGIGSIQLNINSGLIHFGDLGLGAGAAGILQYAGAVSFDNLNLSGSATSYTLNGGTVTAGGAQHIDGGTFAQTGGANLLHDLSIDANGLFQLGGGNLTTDLLRIHGSAFNQTAGTHRASVIVIDAGSSYTLSGGSIQLDHPAAGGSLIVLGTLNLSNNPVAISGSDGATIDLSAGTVQNAGAASVTLGSNSLLIVKPGFDPYTVFGTFTTQGRIHTIGGDLTVPAGHSINLGTPDGFAFPDALHVAGTLIVQSGTTINLMGSLEVQPGGTVDSGATSNGGELRVFGGAVINNSIRCGGMYAASAVVQNTGSASIDNLSIPAVAGASYTLSAGSLLVGGVAHFDGGNFAQTGGANHLHYVYMTGNASFQFSGGSLMTDLLSIGDGNGGLTAFIQSAGVIQTLHDLAVGSSGYVVGNNGSRFDITGDFFNDSNQSVLWNTDDAQLRFTTGGNHTMDVTGADLGATGAGYFDNYSWGTLELLSGQSLALADGDAQPGGAIYVRSLLLDEGLSQISSITGNGMSIYYDATLLANAYLNDQTYALTGGGSIIPIPEPTATGTVMALIAGAVLRRQHDRHTGIRHRKR